MCWQLWRIELNVQVIFWRAGGLQNPRGVCQPPMGLQCWLQSAVFGTDLWRSREETTCEAPDFRFRWSFDPLYLYARGPCVQKIKWFFYVLIIAVLDMIHVRSTSTVEGSTVSTDLKFTPNDSVKQRYVSGLHCVIVGIILRLPQARSRSRSPSRSRSLSLSMSQCATLKSALKTGFVDCLRLESQFSGAVQLWDAIPGREQGGPTGQPAQLLGRWPWHWREAPFVLP